MFPDDFYGELARGFRRLAILVCLAVGLLIGWLVP